MRTREFLLAARLEAHTVDTWVEAGWLLPRSSEDAERFSDMDLARAQLIRDLAGLGVNDEGIPVVLDLVDQLHGVRRTLRDLLIAIHAQPEAARRELLSAVRAGRSKEQGRPNPVP
jgi:chaperone modulatory protein CbpM